MFFWDYTIFLLIPPLLLALYAQQKVRSTYRHFSQMTSASRISGAEVARRSIIRATLPSAFETASIPSPVLDRLSPFPSFL